MTKNRLVYAALAVAGLLFASLPAGIVVGRGLAWHGAWYGHPGAAFGAVGAVGAAVSHPYYDGAPTCGYYPYPPCY